MYEWHFLAINTHFNSHLTNLVINFPEVNLVTWHLNLPFYIRPCSAAQHAHVWNNEMREIIIFKVLLGDGVKKLLQRPWESICISRQQNVIISCYLTNVRNKWCNSFMAKNSTNRMNSLRGDCTCMCEGVRVFIMYGSLSTALEIKGMLSHSVLPKSICQCFSVIKAQIWAARWSSG